MKIELFMNLKTSNQTILKRILLFSFVVSCFQIVIIPGIISPLILNFFFNDNFELIQKIAKRTSKVCDSKIFLEKKINSKSILGFLCKNLETINM